MKCKLVLFLLAAGAAVGFVGCASDDEGGNRNERTVGRYLDDKVLVQRVKSALRDNDVYKFEDVKVNTFEGTVQLTGFVDTAEQKRRAEEVARGVRGVANVENQISLKGDVQRVRGDVNSRSTTNTPPRSSTNP
jgi:hyperosmotically inducible periplasmic protein